MKNHFPNCITVCTGLSKPHTIYINNRGISIIHTNKLNEQAIKQYYLKKLKMKKYATATDSFGDSYTIFTKSKTVPFDSIIAIPDKPVNR